MGTMRESVLMCGAEILHFTGYIKGIFQFNLSFFTFLIAAHEQFLQTRAMIQLHGNCPYALCCLCGEHPETVEHLISGCFKLASQLYKYCYMTVSLFVFSGCCARSILWSVNPDGLWKMNS